MRQRRLVAGIVVLGFLTTTLVAAERQPQTVAAFDQTRGVPAVPGWLIGPFATNIPRESFSFAMETTRKTLAGPRSAR